MTARLGLLIVAGSLGLASCQDSRSPLWTMSEVHQEVGLVGGHQQLACADCHAGAAFAGVDQACEACHLDQYSAARQPNHLEAGYATSCADCHTSQSWRPARVDHARLGFPLEGAHARAVCAACHSDGTLGPLPTDCWSCHELDAPADHFGPRCADCHTTAAWQPSTFDHETEFPLRRGSHQRYRDHCGSCHLARPEYGRFTCTECHDGEHDRGSADRDHREVRRYTYESTACYQCHPRGSGEDAEGSGD